jgi:FtsP/CotA-like multicopper oxidase with cupredoxin domain
MKVGSLRFALSRRCGMLCAPPDAPFQSEPIKIHWGRRYRLAFVNKSDDMHPLHLHRHNFEITKIHGKETSGIFKDTVLVKGFSRVDVDFVADNPGLTFFHCHQNLHMDFGFMRLFEYL